MRTIPMAAAAACLALTATACSARTAQDDAEPAADSASSCVLAPGVTETSIKLGGSYPLSGPVSSASVVGQGATAYFEHINNSQGGVDGRKIEFIKYDDSYEPAKTLENARRLVEKDKVYALFNVFGTVPNLAIYDYASEKGIPHLYPVSGATKWGSDADTHPWTIGWQPSYASEARVFAQYLASEDPDATVAILYQNDDFGKDLLNGFVEASEGSDLKVVKKVSYEVSDPTVKTQIRQLANTDADVFLDFTTQKFAAQAIAEIADTDWRPLHLLTNIDVSKETVLEPAGLDNAKGIVSTAFLKDPSDPQWADSQDMKTYKSRAPQYLDNATVNDSLVSQGWATAATVVHALDGLDCLSRDALMDAVRNMDWTPPLLLPGVKVVTGPEDNFPIETLQMMRFDGERWQLFGDPIDTSKEAS